MPYKIQKDGSQYCVHKENADGSVGEKVACHESRTMAEDQMKALYANEADKSVEIEIEVEGGEDSESEATPSGDINPMTMGFRSFVDYVEQAWESKSQEDLRYSHVREIFGDHIIVAMGYGMNARMFSVPYMIGSDGVEFETDNMTQVELKTEWVAKAYFDKNPLAVKSLGDGKIGGYAILWGNDSQKDLDGQYFTKDTEDLLTVFKAMGKIPWLVQHAADEVIKSVPVAEVTTLEPDESGLWFEAKVIAHDLYKNYVSRLISAGKLFSSVGALPASVKAEKTGFISRFAVAELSGTWSPADPHQVINGYSVSELKAHYDKLGIDSTGLFADENKTESETSDGQHDAEEAAEYADNDKELFELAQEWLNLQKLQVN